MEHEAKPPKGITMTELAGQVIVLEAAVQHLLKSTHDKDSLKGPLRKEIEASVSRLEVNQAGKDSAAAAASLTLMRLLP